MKDRYGNQLKEGDYVLDVMPTYYAVGLVTTVNGTVCLADDCCDHYKLIPERLVRADVILPALEKLKKIEELTESLLESAPYESLNMSIDIKIICGKYKDILRGESESDPNSTENLGQNPDSTEPEPLNEEVE